MIWFKKDISRLIFVKNTGNRERWRVLFPDETKLLFKSAKWHFEHFSPRKGRLFRLIHNYKILISSQLNDLGIFSLHIEGTMNGETYINAFSQRIRVLFLIFHFFSFALLAATLVRYFEHNCQKRYFRNIY